MNMPSRNEPGDPRAAAGLVTILANASCPHCMRATDTLTDWCCEAGIPVAGLDVARHREAANERHIEHSPAIVFAIGGQERVFAGMPTHAEFTQLTR